MNKQNRIIRAFLIAPLIAPIIYLFGAILLNIGGEFKLRELLSLTMVVLFIAAPVSYIATALIGIPYYYILKRMNNLTRANLIIGGSVLGIATFLLFWASPFGLELLGAFDSTELVFTILIGAILGGGVAWCFQILSGITSHSARTR